MLPGEQQEPSPLSSPSFRRLSPSIRPDAAAVVPRARAFLEALGALAAIFCDDAYAPVAELDPGLPR